MSLKRQPRKTYTPAERAALVSEVDARRKLAPDMSVDAIARQLGIPGATYFTWVSRGVRPATPPVSPPEPRRKSLAEDGRAKAARRYSDAQREALLAEVARRREAGESLSVVLAALDLGRTTYQRWLLACRAAPPAFRAVAVSMPSGTEAADAPPPVPAPAPSVPAPTTLTLFAPGGYRIEGLAVASAIELLRALA